MDNILIATVDEKWNQFEVIGGVYKFIAKVPEFNNIIEQESDGGVFFVDYDGYASLGYRNYPLRPTRVFLKEGEELDEDSHCVPSTYGGLTEAIGQNHNKTIFFLGSPEFATDVAPHVTRISVCVVPNSDRVEFPTVKFPTNIYGEYFLGRTDSEPKMLESINKLKELGGLDENDKLFKCPSNYMFHEFTRSNNSVSGVESDELRTVIINFMLSHQPPQYKKLIFENKTLIVFGELFTSSKMDSYNRVIRIESQELMTRYRKGENFDTDKSDIESHTKWEFGVLEFRYKSINGRMEMKQSDNLDEFISKLSRTHLVGEDIWEITL